MGTLELCRGESRHLRFSSVKFCTPGTKNMGPGNKATLSCELGVEVCFVSIVGRDYYSSV